MSEAGRVLALTRFALAFFVTALAIPVAAPAANARPAAFVAHASTPATGTVGFVLTCAASGTIVDTLIASAADDDTDRWEARVRATYHRASGHLVQAAGHEIVWGERREGEGENGTAFTLSSSVSGPSGSYVARFAWALWGATADCTLRVDGLDVSVTVAHSALALYVPPTEFSTGAYYTDGVTTAEAARVYDTQTPGGAVFAAMSTGGDDLDAVGTFVASGSHAPVVDVCERPRFTYCDGFAVRAASRLTVSMTAADAGGSDPGELWFLALSPDAFR